MGKKVSRGLVTLRMDPEVRTLMSGCDRDFFRFVHVCMKLFVELYSMCKIYTELKKKTLQGCGTFSEVISRY